MIGWARDDCCGIKGGAATEDGGIAGAGNGRLNPGGIAGELWANAPSPGGMAGKLVGKLNPGGVANELMSVGLLCC